ncbi:MAG TPA: ABC transporter ATP-binding protein [Chlamydiales bacterium]|nr:ABC transporter ATP-binding protein [Chlamydiales bacterium]
MASIELDHVSLAYPVYGMNSRSFKTSLVNLAIGGRLNKEGSILKVEAIKNIHLKLKSGDRLGLIGHNGAGKTTLLKVMAQIYEPTQGKVTISGQSHCLFDIMLGMDSELTGYENIMLRGLILGFSKREMEKSIPEIEEFSELGEFLKMPIKSYSSGMLIRLAFGIITTIPSEILLIDEVVSAGDARFMEKAKARMASLIHQSDIMVLSTHDHQAIREFCNQALWLEQGEIKFFGEIGECEWIRRTL